MFLDENEHIKYTSLGMNDGEERVLKFKETHLENLDDFQKLQLKEVMAYTEVMKHVTFTCTASKIGPVSLFSSDPEEVEKRKQLLKESEEREIREKESLRQINRAIGHEMRKIAL